MAEDTIIADNIRSAREYATRFFGFLWTNRPHETDYTVTTTPIKVTTAVQQRIAIIVSNTGATPIAISYNPAVTITTGVVIPAGQAFTSHVYFDGEVMMRDLWVVAGAAGNSTAHVIESLLTGA